MSTEDCETCGRDKWRQIRSALNEVANVQHEWPSSASEFFEMRREDWRADTHSRVVISAIEDVLRVKWQDIVADAKRIADKRTREWIARMRGDAEKLLDLTKDVEP